MKAEKQASFSLFICDIFVVVVVAILGFYFLFFF